MKAGGADIHIIHREPLRGFVMNHMSEWFSGVASAERSPDAYAAVAFWIDPETPGRPGYRATYCTEHAMFPQALLVQSAGAYLVMDYASFVGADRAITELGGSPIDWQPPDDAS